MPGVKNISLEEIAKVDDVCGRDIKNAVIDAAMRVARKRKEQIELSDLIKSIERIKTARINVTPPSEKLSPEETEAVRQKVQAALKEQKE